MLFVSVGRFEAGVGQNTSLPWLCDVTYILKTYILNKIGQLVTEWGELHLLRQPVGGREITVARDKDTTDHEYRIVR